MNISQTDTSMTIDTKGFWSKLTGSRQITMQKGGNTTVAGTGFFGKQLAPVVFPTANITAVRLMTYMNDQAGVDNNGSAVFGSSTNNDQNNRRSRLVLQLNTNDQIEVASKQSSGGLSVNGVNIGGLLQKAPLSAEAQQIASFLNLPADASDSSSFGGIMRGTVETPAPQSTTPPAQPTPPATPPGTTAPTA